MRDHEDRQVNVSNSAGMLDSVGGLGGSLVKEVTSEPPLRMSGLHQADGRRQVSLYTCGEGRVCVGTCPPVRDVDLTDCNPGTADPLGSLEEEGPGQAGAHLSGWNLRRGGVGAGWERAGTEAFWGGQLVPESQ